MAQPNVSREPSMEEILASIRKIIESNDPGTGPGLIGGLPPLYGGDDDSGEESDFVFEEERGAVLDIRPANDIGYAEQRPTMFEQTVAPSSYSPPEAERPVAKNISLADLAARVRQASERSEQANAAPRPAAPVAAAPMQSPLMTGRMVELRQQSHPSVEIQPEVAMSPSEPVAASVAQAAPAMEEKQQAPQVVIHVNAERPPSAAGALETPPQPAAPQAQALVSTQTGEQVAKSFGELAAAIDGSQRRSLDEMAAEMLKPMLREWLDDNLPTLVERLVRAEIERVAGGPRR